MSQGGQLGDDGTIDPQIPTQFVTNSGSAIPLANILNILGAVVAAGSNPFRTIGSGNTVTAQIQIASAIAATDATKIGLSAFNSANFTVDANGFVSASGSTPLSFPTDSGTAIPSANVLNLKSDSVTGGTGIEISGSGNTAFFRMMPNYTLGDFGFVNNAAATKRRLFAENDDNDAASDCVVGSYVTGTSAADPYMQVGINSQMVYGFGIDNSDSDTFKIAANSNANSATPSGGTIIFTLTSAGVMTLPQAPLGATSGGTSQSTYATGDLLYASGANTLAKRTIGSTGQLLTVSGGIPTWSTFGAAQGASLVLISSQTASNSANISFTGLTTYNNYLLVWRSAWAATAGANLQLLTSVNNGSSYATTGYFGGINYNAYNTTVSVNINATTNIPLSGPNSSGVNCSGYIYLHDVFTGDVVIVNGQVGYSDNSLGTIAFGKIGGESIQTAVNAIRLQMSSGNMTVGTFDLYGIKEV